MPRKTGIKLLFKPHSFSPHDQYCIRFHLMLFKIYSHPYQQFGKENILFKVPMHLRIASSVSLPHVLLVCHPGSPTLWPLQISVSPSTPHAAWARGWLSPHEPAATASITHSASLPRPQVHHTTQERSNPK